MEEWKNPNQVTVSDLIHTLQKLKPESIVLNGQEENIRVYPGKENKPGGKEIVMLC
ncbi:MAG: hypothetical protein H2212_03615 [Ruminococcus sp.]|nr:hypothetical protein [Ruminococcus sp.]